MQALLGFSSSSRGGTPLSRAAARTAADASLGTRQESRATSKRSQTWWTRTSDSAGRTTLVRLEWYEEQSHALDHPLGLVQAARCQGLQAARGDVDTAVAHFDAALDFGFPVAVRRTGDAAREGNRPAASKAAP